MKGHGNACLLAAFQFQVKVWIKAELIFVQMVGVRCLESSAGNCEAA
jgi:hypothetical protein